MTHRPTSPPPFKLGDIDGKLEVAYDYFIGLSEMEGGRYI